MQKLRYDPRSIKSGLTLATLLCWILPIIIIVTMFSVLVNYYNDRNLEQATDLGMENAMHQVELRLLSVIEDSKSVSYDGVVRQSYIESSGLVYKDITEYLTQKFTRNANYRCVFISSAGSGEPVHAYAAAPGTAKLNLLRYYTASVYPEVKSLLEHVDTGIYFLTVDDEIYMVRNLLDHDFTPYAMLVLGLEKSEVFQSIYGIANISVTGVSIDGVSLPVAAAESGAHGYLIAARAPNTEFRQLYSHFNAMSSELKSQFERLYLEQQALQQAKIRALQSQINPHFLNNTLEIINWEARLADNERVCSMIEALSTMLDAAIGRDGRAQIPLSEELQYVGAYLHITKERLGDRLTVRREIDDAMLPVLIPRLMLQPIVENAVEHDLSRRGGELCLRAFAQADGSYTFEVEHDGEAAFLLDGSWKVGFFSENYADRLDDFSVCYVPTQSIRLPTETIGGISTGYFITRKAWDDPDKRGAAVAFVSQLTSDAVIEQFVTTETTALLAPTAPAGGNSLYRSAAQMNAAVTKYVGAVQDTLSGEARSSLFANIPNIVTGRMTAHDAVAQAIRLNEGG